MIFFAHNLRRSQVYVQTCWQDFKEVVKDDIFYAMLSFGLFKWKSEKLLFLLLLGVLINSQWKTTFDLFGTFEAFPSDLSNLIRSGSCVHPLKSDWYHYLCRRHLPYHHHPLSNSDKCLYLCNRNAISLRPISLSFLIGTSGTEYHSEAGSINLQPSKEFCPPHHHPHYLPLPYRKNTKPAKLFLIQLSVAILVQLLKDLLRPSGGKLLVHALQKFYLTMFVVTFSSWSAWPPPSRRESQWSRQARPSRSFQNRPEKILTIKLVMLESKHIFHH